ncbi:MAG: ABC transporter permease subunit [Candidatus Thermoplasmatota archaeon]|jgi:multiple sugar transport system permease protein|nr:ABC transporter permease subunit [Candidatus Thermoplasmatota archaeon]MCL5791177.1 ABC transporter permease subunit [Candidatus Thermoplasmatota archaeon]
MRSPAKKQAIYLIIPALIYFLIFAFYPMVENIVLTFQQENVYTGALTYVGLKNYSELLQTPYMGQIFENTLIYTLFVPFFDIILSIPLASFMKRLDKPYILPLVLLSSLIPLVTSAVIWSFMLNPFYGVLYYIDKVDLFSNPWMIVIIDIWTSLPLSTLIIYSGLRSIPTNIEEASQMDGIIGARKLFTIDLPYVKSSILSATVLMILYGSFTFDPIYVVKSSAAPFSITDLSYYSYQLFFSNNVGFAAVLMTIMTATSTVIALLFVRLTLWEGMKGGNQVFKFMPNREMPRYMAWFFTVLYMAFFLFPFLWLILESLKSNPEIVAIPPIIIPYLITTAHYTFSFITGEPYFLTSLAVSLGTSILVLFLGAPAAYATSRYRIGGLKFIGLILFIYSLPTVIFMIPVHNIVYSIGMINSWEGLIISYPVFVLPLTIWMLYNFYSNFPKHLDEAANMDGMNVFKTFYSVILRLSGDGISVTLLYSFILAWGALIFPLALTYTPFNMSLLNPSGAQTATIFVGSTIGHEAFNYGALSAASVISIIPSLLLIYIARKRIEKLWRVGGNVS